MLWTPPPPPPVSYSREVAPIMAMHCSGCHGEAGAFSTRTYAGLMAGGNLGKAVLPGDPEASLLMHFIQGLRGEQRRMPVGGAPLSPDRIALIARWIAEGAEKDSETIPEPAAILHGVRLQPGRLMRLECAVSASSYLQVRVVHPASGRVLWSDEGAVKSPRERGDLGEPGRPVTWDVRVGPGWPDAADVELIVRYGSDASPKPALTVRVID